jgi:Protein of unknown function (DUF1553)/Protein of unknown function (DUF1549)/Planctomycete cytochrome C
MPTMTGMKHCLTRRFFACWLCFAVCTGSTYAQDAPSAEGVEYFENHIRPLLVTRCYSCHSQSSGKSEGELLLDSRDGWTVGGDNGPSVIPGDIEASLLISAVRYDDADLQMPPDKKLSPDAIKHLERWVQLGAPDPRNAKTEQHSAAANPSDPVSGRQHWAFRPLIHAAIPDVESKDWPRSDIDAFVLAQLEQHHLQPVPDASRRTLIRRTCFLLVGLPPTEQQLHDFLADDRPEAFEQLVDELLDSPQFGERWGRHWLDLARYADSNGLDENFLFREAWRYRNSVIDALNTDMPFDQFLTQQIAGDLLPYESVEQRDQQRIAAGFMVIGPKVLLGNNANERIMDVADEQLDTIGRAVLGQTLGCARCHDHKFDPVPTADYYALAGILTSTKVMQRRYMLGQQRLMERLVGLGPDGDTLNEAYELYWRKERSRLQEHVKNAKAALALLNGDKQEALAKIATNDKDSVAPESLDPGRSSEERVASQQALIDKLQAAIDKPPAIPPRAMIPDDSDSPSDEAIRLAGQFNQSGDTVPRGFLQVISDSAVTIPDGQSGRLQFATWLTDTDNGAGVLAARVLANRVWQHLFGRGIVRTVDNFGRAGEPPSHPELLDHLAQKLIDSGWSIKSLIRSIVLSHTFALSSQHNEANHAIDPENRWLWRSHRQRLDPESLRDAMLSAAGTLDLKPMDSTVSYMGDQATAVGENKNRRRTDFPCRSVYLPVIRNDLPELFDVFDFADPHAATGMRPHTMVATQGLFILNDDSVMDAAEATVRLVLTDANDAAAQVNLLFELVLGDRPTDEERDQLLTFIELTERRLATDGHEEPRLHAWAIACQALFASSRFQILE